MSNDQNFKAMTTAATNQIATKDFFAQKTVQGKFNEMLGKRSTQFVTSVLQVVNSNDLLKKATPESIYGAAVTAAVLDLPIQNNLGFAYIVPFNDRKSGQCLAQFQIGHKGIKQLALRSGQFKFINDTDVRDGEIKKFDRLSGEIEFEWIEDFKEREKRKIIGYVSYFRLNNGFESTFFKTIEQLEAHGKKYSQTFKKGFGVWVDDFDSMCRKTVTKLNLSKNAPLSVEMQKAITFDQSITNDGETVEYIDNQVEEIIEVNAEETKKAGEKLTVGLFDEAESDPKKL